MKKQMVTGIAAALGMLILILDGQTALIGAQEGLELCLKTVIPSIFPFFVLSSVMTNALSGTSLQFFRPLRLLCNLPKGGEPLLVSAFLGGYPVGAQCISQAFHCGQLEKQEAERMLGFCNNAGPAFLFGMVSFMFPQKWMVWALWIIHIISAILSSKVLPGHIQSHTFVESAKTAQKQSLSSAIRVMATVCGWIILFRILLSFLSRWVLWCFPLEVQVLLTGLLELSNGCSLLPLIQNVPLRFIVCSMMLSFGGLCVTMQTVAVIGSLSLRFYFLGKLLQTLFSLILCTSVILGKWEIALTFSLLFLFFPGKAKKRVAFPPLVLYNDATL